MHPYIVQVVAAERVRDMRRQASAFHLARLARRERAARAASAARSAVARCAGSPVAARTAHS